MGWQLYLLIGISVYCIGWILWVRYVGPRIWRYDPLCEDAVGTSFFWPVAVFLYGGVLLLRQLMRFYKFLLPSKIKNEK